MNRCEIILLAFIMTVAVPLVHGQAETAPREDQRLDNTNKPQEGTTKEYYDSGELRVETTYQQGKVESKKEYLKNGKLERETRYVDDKRYETRIEYYSTGELFRERQLINGLFEGVEKEYYQNGKLKAERNYKNGKRHGSAMGYYMNGNLQGDWVFEEGSPVKATIFFSTGEKWLEHTDFDKTGRLNGVSKEYDKEGHFIARRYYKDDIMIKRENVKKWF